MRLLTGDETGLIKSIHVEKEQASVVDEANVEQSRENSIQQMCWLNASNNDCNFSSYAVVKANGIVSRYSVCGDDDSKDEYNWTSFEHNLGSSKIVGMEELPDKRIVLCNEEGTVGIYDPNSEKKINNNSTPTITFSVLKPTTRMRRVPNTPSNIVVGGKEHDVTIWNVDTQSIEFKAKNVPHDKLDMRVPVWVKDMVFLPTNVPGTTKLLVGTAYHQIRMYHIEKSRKPIVSVEFGEYPVTSLTVLPDRMLLLVGDTTGELNALDLSSDKLRHAGRFAGPAGSIRSIATHPSLPYIAATGLDRRVYVFHSESRALVKSIFLKQRQNVVLFTNAMEEKVMNDSEEDNKTKKRKMQEMLEEDDDEFFFSSEEEEEDYEGLEISNAGVTSGEEDCIENIL